MKSADNSRSRVLDYGVPAQNRLGPTAWDVVGGAIASIISLAAFSGAATILAYCLSNTLRPALSFTDFQTSCLMFATCVICGLIAVRSAKARFRGLPEEVLPAFPTSVEVQVHRPKCVKDTARLFSIVGGVLLCAAVVFLLSLLFRKDADVALDLVYWSLVVTLATMAFGLFRVALGHGEPDRLNL